MLFYKIQGVIIARPKDEQEKREDQEIARTICIKTDAFNSQNDKNSFYFIADASDCVISAGVITDKSTKIQFGVEKFLESVDLRVRDITVMEVTFNTLASLLKNAY